MLRRLRPLLAPALVTLVGVAFLCGLGAWQVRRLAWKRHLLATIDSRIHAPPAPLPSEAAWPALRPDDYEYRKVTLTGTFDNAKETPVYGSTSDGVGYYVMTPMHLRAGGTVLVNRGYVPPERKDPATREAGEPRGAVQVTGLMRRPEGRNIFTPADDPAAGQYFTRDPATLAARDGVTDAAPFTVDVDATPNPGGLPRGGTTEIAIPNNHLTYALTWFGTALALVAVFVSFARRRLAQEGENAQDRHSPTRILSRSEA